MANAMLRIRSLVSSEGVFDWYVQEVESLPLDVLTECRDRPFLVWYIVATVL